MESENVEIKDEDCRTTETENCQQPVSPGPSATPSPCESATPDDGKGKQRKRRRSAESKCSSRTSSVSSSKLKSLKLIVDKAVEHHKTFIVFGRFPSIREALKSRGWVQNCDPHRSFYNYQKHHHKDEEAATPIPPNSPRISFSSQSSEVEQTDEDREAHLISRLLRDTPVNFIWAMGDNIDWKSLSKTTIVSRFPRVYFTTKVGLCNYLQQTHWFSETGISYTLFPRCYNISTMDDLSAFISDFRITACLSLLNLLVNETDSGREDLYSEEGKVPLTAVEFAARRCSEFVSTQEHEDIDQRETEKIWDHQWDQFLTWYYQLAHEKSTFVPATDAQKKTLYLCCKFTIEAMNPHWPQMHLDGVTNLWIVKPGAKSRGRGIQVMRKLEDIIHRVGNLHAKDPRYVVQKYIEKPFLIYNTKFDIRQWFLVTCAYPLTIWMYKESYLRFCSQLFSLTNMHESVHLSNNAVQCKYKNAKRDQALPDENMWDCYTFKTYLRAIGQADMWDKVIYPGMRESITGTLLAAQEHMEQRKNCFELYGADFMLTEDLVPWLIEINSSPCMSPTTSVTARMCAQCLEDVIKVVVDRRHNKLADTGMFELVYRQQVAPPQPYMGMNLTVRGVKIQRSPKMKRKRRPVEPEVSMNLELPSSIKGFIEDLSVELNKETDIQPPPQPLPSPPIPPTPEPAAVFSSRKNSTCSESSLSDSGTSDSSSEDGESDDDIESPDFFNDRKIEINAREDTNGRKIAAKPQGKETENGHTMFHHKCIQTVDEKSQQLKPTKRLTLKSQEKSNERLVKGNPPKVLKDHNKMKKHELELQQQGDESLYDWKQRVDRTRASCEEMLMKLKAFREKDLTCKVHRGVEWRASENESVEEIMKRLKQPRRKTFMERLPLVCSRRSSKSTSSGLISPSPGPIKHFSVFRTVKSSLPQIRHKHHPKINIPQGCINNSLYAIGLRLKCERATPDVSPRERLLLPMGSEQYHGLNLTSISTALVNNCV